MNKIGHIFAHVVLLVCVVLAFGEDTQAGKSDAQRADVKAATSTSAAQGDQSPIETGGPISIGLAPDLFTGVLNMQLPIDLPPGRSGMQPHVALQYQSGSASGWLGFGWRLELGSIERNTSLGAVADCADDSANSCYYLTLDGARFLIVKNSSGTFSERQEGRFLRIKKIVDSSNAESWEVTDKRGVKYFFGQTPLSRQVGNNRTVRWFLDGVQDTSGNFVKLSYQNDGSDMYPLEIDYTGSQDLPPMVSVMFELEPRTDVVNHYEYGVKLSTSQRLKSITTKANGDVVRKYVFQYSQSESTARSLLQSVTLYGSDLSKALRPINFQYNHVENGWFFPDLVFSNGPDVNPQISQQCLEGDFNGDGRVDVACYTGSGGVWHVALSNSGGWNATYWHNGPDLSGPVSDKCFATDFSGDGKTDLACYTGGVPGGWAVAISTGSDFRGGYWKNGPSPSVPVRNQCVAADLGGVGLGAIVCWVSADVWHVSISDGSGWGTSSNWGGGPVPTGPVSQSCVAGDVDGDGKADLLCTNGGGAWSVATSKDVGWETHTWIGPANFAKDCYKGDLNGDGLQDIACQRPSDKHWIVGLSTGTGWDTQDWGPDPDHTANNCTPGDFNGDGRLDIACYSVATKTWRVALSTGSGFQVSQWNSGAPYQHPERCFAGDVIGGGKTDIVCYAGNRQWVVTTPYFEAVDFIKTIVHPFGGVTDFSYQYSTQSINTLLPFNVHVVSSVTTTAGIGFPFYTKKYKYAAGYYDIRKREFRGFGQVTVSEPTGVDDGNTKQYSFHQGAQFGLPSAAEGLIGKLKELVISDSAGVPLRKIAIQYVLGSEIPPHFDPPYEIDTYTFGGSSPLKTSTSYTFDAYGNIVREERPTDVSTATLVTTRKFLSDETNWLVGLPTNESKYQHTATDTLLESTDIFYDDSDNCAIAHQPGPPRGNVTRVRRWSSDSGRPTPEVIFGYDQYGNVVCRRDANGNLSKVSYDPQSHVFPKVFINALGHITKFSYVGIDGVNSPSGAYGHVAEIVDANDLTTKLKYDVFGRLVNILEPDRSSTEWVYGETAGTVHYVQTNFPEHLTAISYLDGFGRSIKDESSGPHNSTIVQERTYGRAGLISSWSLPYYKSVERPSWNYRMYDALNRVKSIVHTDGSQLQYCYAGIQGALVDENGHWKIAVEGVSGRIAEIREFKSTAKVCDQTLFASGEIPYATTKFSYDPLARLIGISDAHSNRTELGWNSLSEAEKIVHPDFGAELFQYDANGNLVLEKDNESRGITWKYDKLNRVVHKSYIVSGDRDSVATFRYDEGPNGRGLLSEVRDRSGVTEYGYDAVGRVVTTTQAIGSKRFNWQFGYDEGGRLTAITYPNSADVKYTYDGPFIGNVKLRGAPLYQINDYTALGQPRTSQAFDGTSRRYAYYDGSSVNCAINSRRLCEIVMSSNAVPLRDVKYEYDSKGNVTKLTIDGRVETLGYDSEDRLLSTIRQPSGKTTAYAYDEIGNMTLNSRLGTYTYSTNGIRPHAVQSVAGRGYLYDQRGNLIEGPDHKFKYDLEGRVLRISTPTHRGDFWKWLFPKQYTSRFQYDWRGAQVLERQSRIWPYPFAWVVPARSVARVEKLYECSGRNCLSYFQLGNAIVARVDGKKNIESFHTDLLRSTLLTTTVGGGTLSSVEYQPYGESWLKTFAKKVDPEYRFAGQRFDPKHKLEFSTTRYYDPVLARFISPDRYLGYLPQPQALNSYTYAANNPQSLIDRSGHGPDDPGDVGGGDDDNNEHDTDPKETNSHDSGTNVNDIPVGSLTFKASDIEKKESSDDPDADKTLIEKREPIFVDKENFAPGGFNSNDTKLTSEFVLSAGLGGAVSTGGDRVSISYGPAVSVNLLAAKVSFYPVLRTTMVASTKGDAVIAGAGASFDIGVGQGSITGLLGPSNVGIVSTPAGGGSVAYNETYRGFGVSLPVPGVPGKEVGAISGVSNTVSLFGNDPITILDAHSIPDAISAFMLEMNNYLWGQATGGKYGPMP